jgi:hypothetical protein
MKTLAIWRLLPLLALFIVACGMDEGDGADAPTIVGSGGTIGSAMGGTRSGGTNGAATGGVRTGGTAALVMGGFPAVMGGFPAAVGGFSSGGLRTGGTTAIRTGGTRATGGSSSGLPTTCSCACYCDACNGPYVKTCVAGDTSCATCRGPCIEYCAATPTCGGEVLASGSCMVGP